MANDFIKLDRNNANATQCGALLNYISLLRQAYEMGMRVRSIMTHNNTGTDFTQLEALFGVPVGKGQQVFDLVNGSTGAMVGTFQNNNCQTITEQVG
jgi:hypothetical protein